MSNTSSVYIEIKSESEPYLVRRPQGYYEYQLPISAKGILCVEDKVLLVGNARGEFELPGGKLEKGESPEECARREVAEEVGLEVAGGKIVHAWVYEIFPDRHVFVIAYGVTIDTLSVDNIALNVDKEVGRACWVPVSELDSCPIPSDYSVAIRKWSSMLYCSGLR
jgi:mutator protein MutT